MMKFENKISLEHEKAELAERNLRNLKRLKGAYKITLPAVALGEVINHIKEKIPAKKKTDCLNWLWNFLNEYNVDILPIHYDVYRFAYQYNNNCVFSVAKEIASRENKDPNESYSGKTLDGNDALILAQAILDECDMAIILTVDSRMSEATTPHDIIEEMGMCKKLRIVNDLSEI